MSQANNKGNSTLAGKLFSAGYGTARLSVADGHVQDAKKALATATVRQRLFHLRPVRSAATQACCCPACCCAISART
jgi:hypothetical protein